MTALTPVGALDELRRAALATAEGAGAILVDFSRRPFAVAHKATVDLVTDADRASENFILERIGREFPDHAVLAEESGVGRVEGPYRWLVDPLDGTTNYAHRVPYFSVLVAVQERQPGGDFVTVAAVTHDPVRKESFWAVRGAGAFVDGAPIRVSGTTRLLDALLATGFSIDRLFTPGRENHAEFCRLSLVSQAVRRFGSAGLDLAYVAAGRFDGFWEYGLHPWDMAGGLLLVAEAGGRQSTVEGAPLTPEPGSICVSNGILHQALVTALVSARAHPANSRVGLAALLPPEVAAEVDRRS